MRSSKGWIFPIVQESNRKAAIQIMSTAKTKKRPVVLCILDGWGVRAETDNNAIALAKTPVWDRLLETYPQTHLDASEHHVGLPRGQMGNSEVGHMNLGAGRIVMQDLPRIDAAIADGSIQGREALVAQIDAVKKSGGTCHVMGLLSPGGVHAHQAHMLALARTVAGAGVPVAIHAFLDGRDTPPNSAADFVMQAERDLQEVEGARLVTLCGRYFAMDRDSRWDRVSKAYDLIVDGIGRRMPDGRKAVMESYNDDVRDEFVEPVVLGHYQGMQDGDAILMANFRADRTRQILESLIDPKFSGFSRNRIVDVVSCVGMVEYSTHLTRFAPALFSADRPENVLGQVVAKSGLSQLRIAETEKYAHVTFFLNGGRESVFEGEDRILVPSPDVATYDLCPEMSAVEVTDNLVRVIDADVYDLIVVNFANGDMVGHTGVLSAAITAVETLDACLARLEKSILDAGGVMFVTADHGNCECMMAEGGDMHTAHTLNLVPAVLVGASADVTQLQPGRLCDVAPTLLKLLGLTQPTEMSGQSLIRVSDDNVQNTAAE